MYNPKITRKKTLISMSIVFTSIAISILLKLLNDKYGFEINAAIEDELIVLLSTVVAGIITAIRDWLKHKDISLIENFIEETKEAIAEDASDDGEKSAHDIISEQYDSMKQ